MELFFFCRCLHGAFVLFLSAPICSGLCAVVWNICTRHFVARSLSTSSAASCRCSRISSSRGLVEGLVLFRAMSVGDSCARLFHSFSTWFRRVSVVAVAPLRLLQAPPFLSRRLCHESVIPISHAHLAVGVSRARHRLSVTFEMFGFCCCSDAMSSSSWILSFAPSSQQLFVHELS